MNSAKCMIPEYEIVMRCIPLYVEHILIKELKRLSKRLLSGRSLKYRDCLGAEPSENPAKMAKLSDMVLVAVDHVFRHVSQEPTVERQESLSRALG